MYTNYVVGFLFSPDFHRVVMIEKSKPEFQKGLLNGVGGKMEETDASPQNALEREFKEETGATVEASRWHFYALWNIPAERVSIFFFAATGNEEVATMESEEVGWMYVKNLRSFKTLQNVQWLVPAGIHALACQDFMVTIEDKAGANHG